MKKNILLALSVVLALSAIAAGLIQSGWTTTADPATARAALGVTQFGIDFNSIVVTNGITNLDLTASTILKADANQALASIVNAAGALTNNGSGVFGFYPGFPALDANNHFTGANLFSGASTFTALSTFSANLQINANIAVTGGLTNGSLSPSTVASTDSNKKLISIANGSGALLNDGAGNFSWSGSTPGTVSSVALSVPAALLSVAGSPITGSGTFTVTLPTQSPNTFFSGPSSGGVATPTFRAMADSDLLGRSITGPAVNSVQIFGGAETITNSLTNLSLTANALVKADANQVLSSVANGAGFLHNNGSGTFAYQTDGSTLTNLTYRYTTSAIPALTISFTSKAYFTNIAADFTVAIAAPDNASFETCVLFVTNSSATDWKITFPNGVWGTPGSGTPPAYYCTNKMLTRINVEHFGQQITNAFKLDFAP